VAGGVVIVPVLTSRRIGMARATASGTTIAAVLPISVVAALTYAGLHNVDERAASAIVPGAAAGVIIGSLLATRVRASVLRVLFQIVLLATAVRLLVALPSGSIHQIALEVPAAVMLCALGAVAGLASGMLGSGGGSFLVPALVLGFAYEPLRARVPRTMLAGVAAAAVCVATAAVVTRNTDFRSLRALLDADVRVRPDSAAILIRSADLDADEGRLAQAEPALARVTELAPPAQRRFLHRPWRHHRLSDLSCRSPRHRQPVSRQRPALPR
jgi:uncharacterized membrane protein YfcA